jgi:hypothetical protein
MAISFQIGKNHFERTAKEVESHTNFTGLSETNVNVLF